MQGKNLPYTLCFKYLLPMFSLRFGLDFLLGIFNLHIFGYSIHVYASKEVLEWVRGCLKGHDLCVGLILLLDTYEPGSEVLYAGPTLVKKLAVYSNNGWEMRHF